MGFISCCWYLINALLLLPCIQFDFISAKSTLLLIRDSETISSNDGAFRLGFFSPVNTTNRYVGIWYLNESNIIWVANRFEPVKDTTGIFTISDDGNLVVLNGQNKVVWSSNVSIVPFNSTARLLDSGNLILLDATTGKTVWESFQHPSDTMVSEMKISSNGITELEKHQDTKRIKGVIIGVTVTVAAISLAASAYVAWKWTAKQAGSSSERMIEDNIRVKLEELPLVSFEKLVIATNNFHSNNMIGQGGFGAVYKGELQDGKTIAVKRLSRVSRQGGYMSPEYAMRGLFSEKSDVYSFGILLLEIVSSKRNTNFYDYERTLNLTGFAWKLWNENNITSLIDQEIADSGSMNQILRCIHIGLLCVQEVARVRPTMTTVISMLNSEIVNLPPPKQVAFIPPRQNLLSQEPPHGHHRPHSINSMSVTDMQGR
ncbi:hypothetical protein L6164_036534 [Bauhinia variegata]|uniref:Uncharacterized protein n=1 Tax=Bauhinia variegata TaxID=167791 RepID=A0ACB9KHH9_BAUVA|nr:hypothetical protein L6164_036534 [Bauhinia variegata]